VCYGFTTIDGAAPVDVLRIGRKPVPSSDPSGAAILAMASAEPSGEAHATIDLSSGAVCCIRLPIGYIGEGGHIVVGASRAGFPEATELVTLRAGLSLAASGLETARVIHQRDEAQRAKDEFLAMLGHELRNPLAPIVTAVQLMALKAGAAKTREQQIIERQVQHLRRLVDDLLDVSRIARGKIELRPSASISRTSWRGQSRR
jgi:signal transduction histidine kinase